MALVLNGGRLLSRQMVAAHFDEKTFPVKATRFIAQRDIRDHLFSTDAWSGYLIYKLYPQTKVYFDDRHDFYGDAFIQGVCEGLAGNPAMAGATRSLSSEMGADAHRFAIVEPVTRKPRLAYRLRRRVGHGFLPNEGPWTVVTNYIRFFHIEIYHLRFVAIEALVTLMVLLLFVLLPVRFLAFFPNRGFRRFAQKRLRACVAVFFLSLFGPDCAVAYRAV